MLEAARRIARVAPDTLLVLQPVTPRDPCMLAPGCGADAVLAAAAEADPAGVRVIPQTHPIYGVP